MDSIVIYIALYGFLLFADLIPAIKKKEKKALYFSIPVYLLTLAINIMMALGTNIPSPNGPIIQIINSIFHVQ